MDNNRFFIFVNILIFLSCQKYEYYDIGIDVFKNITVIEFSSNEAYNKLINKKNKTLFKEILHTAILINTDNIINHNTTRTSNNSAYNFKYIFINDDLEYYVLEKHLIKYVYNPLHPDKIYEGEMNGYVEYPDIDIFSENESIITILEILNIIDN